MSDEYEILECGNCHKQIYSKDAYTGAGFEPVCSPACLRQWNIDYTNRMATTYQQERASKEGRMIL